jgi:hypothetical protein
MADRFFDTSAAVKHYHPEIGTARVEPCSPRPPPATFSPTSPWWNCTPFLARLVRTGTIAAGAFHLARGPFLADIAGGEIGKESRL